MKKTLIFFFSLFLMFSLFSCKDKNIEKTYDVIFYTYKNDAVRIPKQTVKENEKIKEPKKPVRLGYKHEGWFVKYGEYTPSNHFNFENDTIKGPTTLYSKWIKITVEINFILEKSSFKDASMTNTYLFGQEKDGQFETKFLIPELNVVIGHKYFFTYDEGDKYIAFKQKGIRYLFDEDVYKRAVDDNGLLKLNVYAFFVVKEYQFTFYWNRNTSDYSTYSQTVKFNDTFTERKNGTGNLAYITETRDGKEYKIASWNTKRDGTGATVSVGDVSEFAADTKFYAQWIEV